VNELQCWKAGHFDGRGDIQKYLRRALGK
jgi:hypothetical protein